MAFDVGDRIVVVRTSRTEEAGIADWHGEIAGKSYANDDPGEDVLAYAVAMDEAAGRTWMVGPKELEREAI